MPEVSVVMSCYNAGQWLQPAVESALAQSFEDLELILIDDGSTDETPQILAAMRESDRRIVVLTRENSGLARSLNAGIRRAQGSWIARLDADDLCEPERIERQMRYLRNYPDVVLLGSGFTEIDARGDAVKEQRYPAGHGKLVRNLQKLRRMFPHSSAIFSREAASRAGLYNHLFRKSQDWDLWLRLSERGRIACIPDSLVRIRKHGAQISSSGQGPSQFVYGTGAIVCHFLRLAGKKDPSAADESGWSGFLQWVARRLADERLEEMHYEWGEYRSAYLDSRRSVGSLARFAGRTIRSGHALRLAASKLIGSSLPRRLAREWAARQCAA